MARQKSDIARKVEVYMRFFYNLAKSPVGALVILGIYAVAGAVMFQKIEGVAEQEKRVEFLSARKQFLSRVLDNYEKSDRGKMKQQIFKQLLSSEMKKFEERLLDAYSNGVTAVEDEKDTEPIIFDFWGSLFYCFTVFTTIGYGNIFPYTDGGKLATVGYAVLGIPVCLLAMNEIGKCFTRYLKSLIGIIKNWHDKNFRRKKRGVVEEPAAYEVNDTFDLPIKASIVVMLLYHVVGVLLFSKIEEWEPLDSFYFLFVTLSTIGFGDVLPSKPKHFLAVSLYLLLGLAIVGMCLNTVLEYIESRYSSGVEQFGQSLQRSGIDVGLTDEKKDDPPVEETCPTPSSNENDTPVRRRVAQSDRSSEVFYEPQLKAVANPGPVLQPKASPPRESPKPKSSQKPESPESVKKASPLSAKKNPPKISADETPRKTTSSTKAQSEENSPKILTKRLAAAEKPEPITKPDVKELESVKRPNVIVEERKVAVKNVSATETPKPSSGDYLVDGTNPKKPESEANQEQTTTPLSNDEPEIDWSDKSRERKELKESIERDIAAASQPFDKTTLKCKEGISKRYLEDTKTAVAAATAEDSANKPSEDNNVEQDVLPLQERIRRLRADAAAVTPSSRPTELSSPTTSEKTSSSSSSSSLSPSSRFSSSTANGRLGSDRYTTSPSSSLDSSLSSGRRYGSSSYGMPSTSPSSTSSYLSPSSRYSSTASRYSRRF